MYLSGIKNRVDKLIGGFESPLPPYDSVAFSMHFIHFTVWAGNADNLTEREKKYALDLEPLTFEEGYSRDMIMKAQQIIRKSLINEKSD